MAEGVDAADEHGGRLVRLAHVSHVRGDVADAETDPPPARSVRLRAMQGEGVVQREFAGRERRVHRRPIVHRALDGLARAVHAAGHDAGAVRQLAPPVAAGQELHAAVLRRGVGQREPRRHVQVRVQPEIRGVLVPGRDGRALGLLDEPGAREHEDVGSDEALDGVEHGRVADEGIDPRQQDVRARAVPRRLVGSERPADGALEGLELVPAGRGLRRGERALRPEEAVARVARDRGGGERGGHHQTAV